MKEKHVVMIAIAIVVCTSLVTWFLYDPAQPFVIKCSYATPALSVVTGCFKKGDT